MGLIHSPSIVSDGLVLALDAQNSRSYGGSGTTWTGVSYNGNNGTLTNGPTFEPGGPFAGSTGGSVSFDGSGGPTSTGSNLEFSSTITLGTGDFTVETWIYNTVASQRMEVWQNTSLIGAFAVSTNFNASDGMNILTRSSPPGFGWSVLLRADTELQHNSWNHIAWVRSGGTLTAYLNGVADGNISSSIDSSPLLTIGGWSTGTNYMFGGNISNLRIIKGTALYISNFTPPIKPLTPVSGTSLLTCQGGAIVDNSSNKFSITKNGDARAIQSASIKFDGVNDFGEVARSNDFDFGTGELTIESWVYITAYNGEGNMLVYKTQSSASAGNACGNYVASNGLLRMAASDNTTYQVNVSGGTVTLGRWHHICMTRVGSTWTCYLNTTQVSTATWAGSVSHVTTGTFGGIGIGAYTSAYGGDAGRYGMNGNISNARIYKGKGLTAAEVSQNFNSLRGRFGV